MRKKLLSLALALAMCLSLTVPALAADSDFTIWEGGNLAGYKGPGGDVVIPDGVTRIGPNTFSGKNLTSVTLPDSLTVIEFGAFAGCKGLTSVTIPEGVTKIGYEAFQNCTNLTTINIPDGVTEIGRNAFWQCASLTSINIPDGVTDLGQRMFEGCRALSSVTLSSSLTKIDAFTFSNTALTNVTIPDGVTYIGFAAFGSSALTSVTIPASVTEISRYGFMGCPALTDVYYGGTKAQWNAIHIAWDAEYGGAGSDPVETATIHCTDGDIKPLGFDDMGRRMYYSEAAAWAIEKDITQGTGNNQFSPNAACTQGEILTFLWRAKGKPAPSGTVSGTQYYAAAAQWAKEQGLTDTFSGDAGCTRAMVVTYLWKLAGSPQEGAPGFADVSASAACAQAVSWAVKQGVTKGTSDTAFSPDKVCTRGEIVTFLYRGLANS